MKYDTGTEIYKWLRYEHGRVFAGSHMLLMRDEVVHYEGVTRLKLNPRTPRRRAAFPVDAIEATVIDRLRQRYDFTDQDLTRIPDMAPYVDVRREPVGPHPEQATERGSRTL